MHAGFYRRPRNIDEVIHLVGLEEKANSRVKTLSGGQQRRLDLALGLVGDPELLFLDEPTTGFDPSARRQAWDIVRNLGQLGKTILLDHPLHGRGPGPRRPGGGHRGRSDRRRGIAGVDRRTGPCRRPDPFRPSGRERT